MDWLDIGACVLFGIAVITTLVGRALHRDLHLVMYVLWIAAAIGFAIAYLRQRGRKRWEVSDFDAGPGDISTDRGTHGHHDGFDGGHGGDGNGVSG